MLSKKVFSSFKNTIIMKPSPTKKLKKVANLRGGSQNLRLSTSLLEAFFMVLGVDRASKILENHEKA